MADETSLISHLIELRMRLIRCCISVLAVFLLLVGFSSEIYHLIANPLLELLPQGGSMIATEVASPFLTPFKLTLIVAFYLAMPYMLWQIWQFISPGLYTKEKLAALPLFIASVILFYVGTLFALVVVSPLLYAFFQAMSPEGVVVMPDITRFLDFVIKLAFGFGIAFEVPVITFMAVKSGLVEVATLRRKRPFIIVAAFVFATLLTPPDVISQLLLAVPVLVLFEAGLFLAARSAQSGREEEEA